ncbi:MULTISPECIES: mannose-6-phosphate isomerase, class I [unclassified Corynebacterium]|uniref:mannose-6-phosphate isomerase, class I n=1 Tax=unclassified Corynebacterium TaxID=2624378 RepID=UPI0008A54E41|nr:MULTISPECIES: mannose-6-phosphate isomerase, class I [unclassified Corynebacterium]OFN78267.1 mannose-6-phosphate isomerase [Corynebacterium sp. HMSC074E01]OFP61915.1 mannose-6-phosphate isomerase [Corynebacterium sp. HMSC074C01]OHO65925.1 mannose-6-phosphate isomerase [Corynebacterium sp. HMSC036D02]
MKLLTSAARNYSWGSRTLIPTLLGEPEAHSPVAELWFGAHPADPSTIGEEKLDEIIAADPEGQLGQRVADKYGAGLPFLLKILAAAEPLSLQAHPSKMQAEEGFARENAAGIELTAANRNYKDDNHKPELIVALTEFYAMAGFRPLAQTRSLFAALECEELAHYEGMLDADPAAEGDSLRALFTTWITIPGAKRKELISAVVAAGERLRSAQAGEPWMATVMGTVAKLNEQYPGDIGVLGALLLNHIVLQPGEAIYLDAGQLHAYVSGLGVEIMANSDNVLRGGLTPKFVDVPELVKVLTYEAAEDPRVDLVDASETGNVKGAKAWSYPVPIEEFLLDRVELSGEESVDVDSDGPMILLCTSGAAALSNAEGESLSLSAGHAAWIPASDPAATVRAAGAEDTEVFIARV